MKLKHWVGAGITGLAVTLSGAAGAAKDHSSKPQQETPSASTAPDPAKVQALLDAINAQLAALPENASPEDIEARILFAIDQAQASPEIVAAALSQLSAAGSSLIQTAAANVQRLQTRLANQGDSGTGAIGALNNADLSFGPSLSVGGGTANYSN